MSDDLWMFHLCVVLFIFWGEGSYFFFWFWLRTRSWPFVFSWLNCLSFLGLLENEIFSYLICLLLPILLQLLKQSQFINRSFLFFTRSQKISIKSWHPSLCVRHFLFVRLFFFLVFLLQLLLHFQLLLITTCYKLLHILRFTQLLRF